MTSNWQVWILSNIVTISPTKINKLVKYETLTTVLAKHEFLLVNDR